MYYSVGLAVTTPNPLPDGAEDVPYTQTIQADHGTAPYTWDTNITGLPSWLTASQNGNDLELSGTPPLNGGAGSYQFTVSVTDDAQETADKTFDLTVHPPPPELTATPDTLPLGSTLHGASGTPDSYTLDGDYLQGNTTVTASAGFEVSKSDTGPWSSSLSFDNSSVSTLNETVWVRLTGEPPLGAQTGTITNENTNTTGTTTEVVDVDGTVNGHPDIAISRRGPDVTTLVDNDAQGPGSDGLVLLEFTATTSGEDWTINDITFSASGAPTNRPRSARSASTPTTATAHGMGPAPTTSPRPRRAPASTHRTATTRRA